MPEPRLVLLLPDGSSVTVQTEAILGRARLAEVRVSDPRVSTVHAELSWREGRFVVLARGGRVVVDGLRQAAAPVSVGSRIGLAPGVVLEVLDIHDGEAPGVPATAGRAALVLRACSEGVELWRQEPSPRATIEGLPGQLLTFLGQAGGPVPWGAAAGALWPPEAALRSARGPLRSDAWTPIDERRFRNRFDQVLATLRAQLDEVRPGRWIGMKQGEVSLELAPGDQFEIAAAEPGLSGCEPAGSQG